MINPDQSKKVALAHDSFTQLGGAERVIEVLHEIYPDAPVFTLVVDKKLKKRYQNWNIKTSWLQKIYNIYPKFQHLLFLIPWAASSLDFNGFDMVISSSSGLIKNVRLPKNCLHFSYCHTPTRFLWSDKDYVKQEVCLILRPVVEIFLRWVKKWDYNGAQRVNYFIANSKEVQNRISKYYHRTSTVIYPPIDVNFWHKTTEKQNYFLVAGRLQPYKKTDIIVEIFNELGLPLHVVGTGRQEKYLKFIAKPNVIFLGMVNDEKLRDEYSGALGLIYPQVEDFGLMPLEAAACGTATLGLAQGGNLETIIPGVTGELFGQNVAARFIEPTKLGNYNPEIKDQIKRLILEWNPQKYMVDQLRQHAEKFSKEKFKQQILEFINSTSFKT